ncbi:GDP-D-glucose phosphorylase 1 [Brachionus plicatilis]|uniref:GDP-D-glucose phosphorylase 1 n=1 Tax=Brachionus plicatilis TaxID=10195 RepID=A0A3M7RRC3_BRAPC|nr:GDP-D-glucose phosphorylase 1 [Brachionus plicatilis]
MKIFEYSLKNLRHDFELILLDEWSKAYAFEGLFKFKLETEVPTKYLAGDYSFVVQKNSRRYSEKRPTDIQKSSSIKPPFDEKKFNFTKISPQEILLKLINIDETERSDNLIIINNSPIEIGHCLICPKYNEKKNQVLDEYSIKLACHILKLIFSSNFLIGFNSISAYASVNHLHMHLYDLKQTCEFKINKKYLFPIQNCEKPQFYKNKIWFIDFNCYYRACFCVELGAFESPEQFSHKVFSIVNFLSQNDIPHNAVFVKSKSFADQNETIKCFIWPKMASSGCVVNLNICFKDIPPNEKNLCFAITELSGHFILPFDKDFGSINEEFIIDVARYVQPDNEKIMELKDKPITLITYFWQIEFFNGCIGRTILRKLS